MVHGAQCVVQKQFARLATAHIIANPISMTPMVMTKLVMLPFVLIVTTIATDACTYKMISLRHYRLRSYIQRC